jgi:hypothetical protein
LTTVTTEIIPFPLALRRSFRLSPPPAFLWQDFEIDELVRNFMNRLPLACALLFAGCAGRVADVRVPPAKTTIVSRTDDGGKSGENAVLVRASAKVTEVDEKDRTLTLEGPEGNEVKVRVSDAAGKLDNIKKGDMVTTDYYQSVAFEFRAPTPEESASPKTVVDATEDADTNAPEGVNARSIRSLVQITSVDPVKGTVTAKGPDGQIVTVQAQDRTRLATITPGDTVVVTYTEAVAVAVSPMRVG